MPDLTIQLPDTISAEDARLEIAIGLFSSGRLTQGEAAAIAGLSRRGFIELLASRGVPFTNIDVQDLEEELETWRKLGSRTAPP